MPKSHDEEWLPPELRKIDERLRDDRPQASPLELDRIKTRAMTRASRAASARTKGTFMKSRVASVLVVAGLVLGGTAGVVVAGGGVHGSGGSSDSASHSQYCPPSSHGDYHSHDCGHPNPGGGGDHGGGHGGDHGGHGGDHH